MNSPKNFLGLGVVVSVNLIIQFFFQWYILIWFGAGADTDALFGSMVLPQFILLVLSSSLTLVLIPVVSKFEGEQFSEEAWSYLQAVAILFGAVALILFLTAHWWVSISLPGFKDNNFELTVHLAQIQLGGMFFSALLSVIWALHIARGNFYLIETTSILANSVSLLLLFIALRFWGIYVAAWLSVLRVMLQAVFLMKILGPYKRMNLKSTSVKATWKKMKPPIAGNMYYKSDSLIDRYLTSTCVSGELTLFNLAQQLYSMCVSIFNKVFVITLLPKLSEQANKEDWNTFQSLYRKRFFLLFVISLIFYLLVFLMGKPVLIFVFSLKKFAAADAVRLWSILILLFGFWFGGLMGNMTAGGFYTQGDTKTPTILSAILFTIYIPIKVFCFKQFGITGLSITISIYMLTSLVAQMIILELIHRRKPIKNTIIGIDG